MPKNKIKFKSKCLPQTLADSGHTVLEGTKGSPRLTSGEQEVEAFFFFSFFFLMMAALNPCERIQYLHNLGVGVYCLFSSEISLARDMSDFQLYLRHFCYSVMRFWFIFNLLFEQTFYA